MDNAVTVSGLSLMRNPHISTSPPCTDGSFSRKLKSLLPSALGSQAWRTTLGLAAALVLKSPQVEALTTHHTGPS